MRTLIVILSVSIASCAMAPTDFGDKFDVEGGSYIAHIDKPIIEDGFVLCHVVARANALDSSWGPSILLTVSNSEASVSSQVTYSPFSDFHEFKIHTIEGNEYTYSSEFLSLKSNDEKVFLSISWEESGRIGYSAGDSSGQQSTGYIHNPDQLQSKIAVTISGVKGEITCSEEGT